MAKHRIFMKNQIGINPEEQDKFEKIDNLQQISEDLFKYGDIYISKECIEDIRNWEKFDSVIVTNEPNKNGDIFTSEAIQEALKNCKTFTIKHDESEMIDALNKIKDKQRALKSQTEGEQSENSDSPQRDPN